MDDLELTFTLNGRPVSVTAPADARLLDVLRESCGCTSVKEGCGEGECGACTVLIDGELANACLVPAFQVRGRTVFTAEALDTAYVEALNRCGATQCGACSPGVAVTIQWLRDHPELAGRLDLREFLSGNLCRCTGYDGIADGARAVLPRSEPA